MLHDKIWIPSQGFWICGEILYVLPFLVTHPVKSLTLELPIIMWDYHSVILSSSTVTSAGGYLLASQRPDGYTTTALSACSHTISEWHLGDQFLPFSQSEVNRAYQTSQLFQAEPSEPRHTPKSFSQSVQLIRLLWHSLFQGLFQCFVQQKVTEAGHWMRFQHIKSLT